jgi:hypothetical protein
MSSDIAAWTQLALCVADFQASVDATKKIDEQLFAGFVAVLRSHSSVDEGRETLRSWVGCCCRF